MNLSPNFTLAEMVQTVHRDIDNKPSEFVVANLTRLCNAVLEPIRAHFGPLYVSSGYRSSALNMSIGGSISSMHIQGCAADIVPLGRYGVREIVGWIAHSHLPFDQVIEEYSTNAAWVHVGMALPGCTARNEALVKKPGQRYLPF